MARIMGIDLPKNKRVDIGLTYLYGIGKQTSDAILAAAGIDASIRVKDLTEEQVRQIASIITDTYKVEGDLRREVANNIKRLVEISSYRGIRHRRGLPCRGQRTHTNARTRKGKRKMTIAKKKTS